MGELIAHELGEELSELAIYGREGAGERKKARLGIILYVWEIHRAVIRFSLAASESDWKSATIPLIGVVLLKGHVTAPSF